MIEDCLRLVLILVLLLLVLWYGIGPVFDLAPPMIPTMAMTHGLLNAFGFVLPLLWALKAH